MGDPTTPYATVTAEMADAVRTAAYRLSLHETMDADRLAAWQDHLVAAIVTEMFGAAHLTVGSNLGGLGRIIAGARLYEAGELGPDGFAKVTVAALGDAGCI